LSSSRVFWELGLAPTDARGGWEQLPIQFLQDQAMFGFGWV